MNLNDLGWSTDVSKSFQPFAQEGYVAGRVAREEKVGFVVYAVDGRRRANLAGRFRGEAIARRDLPAVGDWVAMRPVDVDRGLIHAVLPRRSAFVRQCAGRRSDDQIVAANVDFVFLVCGLDGDFSVRRLERYLTLAYGSGASPVIVLNKADVCDRVDARVAQVEAVAPGAPVHAISALAADGVGVVCEHLRPGVTGALLGSSGVGKSTILNALLGDARQATLPVRAGDNRGRHTTTHRELFVLPTGGVMIDTPGMRELQLPAAADGIDSSFADIEQLAANCRFRDCRHESEPGCAVRAAVEAGTMDESRLENYRKLGKEIAFAEAREDPRLQRERRDEWKRVHKAVRRRMKARGKW